MKKRIISMLLAVCMVIACTLAITPSVSAEGELEIAADSEVTGAIGDVATVTVKFKNGFSALSAIQLNIKSNSAFKLIQQEENGIVTEKSSKLNISSQGEKANEYFVLLTSKSGANFSVAADELIISFEVGIMSTGKLEIGVNVLSYLNDGGVTTPYVAGEDFSADYITVDVKANGSVPHDITYSYELVDDTGDELITCNKTAAGNDPIAKEVFEYNGGKNACSYRLIQLNLASNAGSDVAYFNADDVENLYDEIDGEICEEYGYSIGFNLTKGKIGGTSTNKAEYVYVRLNLPNNVYFDANVDNAYFAEGENPLIEMVMRNSSNVVFLGDYDSGLPAGFELDEDDYSYYLDNFCFDVTAPDECINVLTWKGNGLYNYLTSDTVCEHMLDVVGIEAENLSFKPLDEFKPMGYQLPTTESGIKGFRIDSEIRYADMMFDEKQVYQSAAVDLRAVVYDSNDSPKGDLRTIHKDIPKVYKSISSNNGPAIAASDGYYFSAVTVKGLDAAGLAEGEYIVFEAVNSVTNCFEATTQSAPVYFKYSFDGSVVQLTDEEIPAEFVSEE